MNSGIFSSTKLKRVLKLIELIINIIILHFTYLKKNIHFGEGAFTVPTNRVNKSTEELNKIILFATLVPVFT